MHLRKTNLGGQRLAPGSGPRRQELPAEETVFRVLVRLSDRKGEWIQRGTGNVSLPGLPGGGGSQLRTCLRVRSPCYQGIITEHRRIRPLACEIRLRSDRICNGLAENSLRAITGNLLASNREDNRLTRRIRSAPAERWRLVNAGLVLLVVPRIFGPQEEDRVIIR